MIKWYAMFSHTGSEVNAVRKQVKKYVDFEYAMTNNMFYSGPLRVKVASAPRLDDLLMDPECLAPGSIVTLNGYMHILPAEVLRSLWSRHIRVFNIHPAPLNLYPELAGKDPQERAWQGIQKGIYDFVGATIHAVDAGVDTGAHYMIDTIPSTKIKSKEDLYTVLHNMAERMWVRFFKEELWKDSLSKSHPVCLGIDT